MYTYFLTVLPRLMQSYVNEFNNLVKDFLWEGKKAKIAYSVLLGNKVDGGLGLCDLDKKDQALKMQWIFKLQKFGLLETLAYDLMENPIKQDIW